MLLWVVFFPFVLVGPFVLLDFVIFVGFCSVLFFPVVIIKLIILGMHRAHLLFVSSVRFGMLCYSCIITNRR